MNDRVFSEEGLEKLKEELKNLKAVTRPEVIHRVEVAQEFGDLSENAEYHDAKDQLSLIDRRMNELEEIINFAVIAKHNKGGAVGTGSTVQVSSGKIQKTFKIVGASEADPGQGSISNESPIGKALLGHEVGDTVEVETPVGKTNYLIEKID